MSWKDKILEGLKREDYKRFLKQINKLNQTKKQNEMKKPKIKIEVGGVEVEVFTTMQLSKKGLPCPTHENDVVVGEIEFNEDNLDLAFISFVHDYIDDNRDSIKLKLEDKYYDMLWR